MKLVKSIILLSALSTIISGCGEGIKTDVVENANELKAGPKTKPERNITGFSDALRCMDMQLLSYGVHDVSMLLEEMKDKTGSIKAGARDMLISAISEMTRRSHAIRAITYGGDSSNIISFLNQANSKSAYTVIPQYSLRGSITQLDKSLAAKDAKVGLNVGGTVSGQEFGFGFGGAKTANASMLGIDLNVASSSDFSLIPGVISKNSVIILKEGSGKNAKAKISKLGVDYSTNTTKAEGNTQALRNLIELGVIEISGKLTKTPYWKCLGVDPTQKEIKNEIDDWWFDLVSQKIENAYFQEQLSIRGFYNGPVDNQYNELLVQAIINYKQGLGMGGNGNLTLELFDALLNQEIPEPPEMPTTTAMNQEPLLLNIDYATPTARLSPGEEFALKITPSSDAHIYCFYKDDKQSIQRFFPNRFSKSSFIKGGISVLLPGKAPFKMFASKSSNMESLVCFASKIDIMNDLPVDLKATDFKNLNYQTLQAIQDEFVNILGDQLSGQYFNIKVK